MSSLKSNKTNFQLFLEEEVGKVKGIYYPVKAGFLKRAFIKKAPCGKLHPNPNDEFCMPEIGPNYEIISRYEKDFRILRESSSNACFLKGARPSPSWWKKRARMDTGS